MLREAPKIKSTKTSCQTNATNPGSDNTILNMIAPKSIMYRLLYLLSNLPVKGIVSINPIGNANKTAPNSASDKCNCACICGILETQEEYPKPERKKNTVLAIRYPLGVF